MPIIDPFERNTDIVDPFDLPKNTIAKQQGLIDPFDNKSSGDDIVDPFLSSPVEPTLPDVSLSTSTGLTGGLTFEDATDPASQAFRDKLMAEARAKVAKEGSLERGARTALASVAPTLAGIGAGAATGAGLGTLGAGPVGTAIGGIVGGIAGGLGGEALQAEAMKKAMGEEGYARFQAEQQARREASPVATFVGETVPQLALFKPSLKNVGTAWQGIKALTKGTLDVASPSGKAMVEQIGNVGLGAGVSGVQEAYAQYQTGDLQAGRLLAQIVAGAVINEPNKFGVKLGFNPSTGEADVIPQEQTTPPVVAKQATVPITNEERLIGRQAPGREMPETTEVLNPEVMPPERVGGEVVISQREPAAPIDVQPVSEATIGGRLIGRQASREMPDLASMSDADVVEYARSNGVQVEGKSIQQVRRELFTQPKQEAEDAVQVGQSETLGSFQGRDKGIGQEAGQGVRQDEQGQGLAGEGQPVETPQAEVQREVGSGRVKYVRPDVSPKDMNRTQLKKELAENGVEFSDRENALSLRQKVLLERNRRSSLENKLRNEEILFARQEARKRGESEPVPTALMPSKKREREYSLGREGEELVGQSMAYEETVQRRLDDGTLRNQGETVYSKSGEPFEIVDVFRGQLTKKERGTGEVFYTVKDKAGNTFEFRESLLTDEAPVGGAKVDEAEAYDAPFRTALEQAKPAEANKLRWVINKMLGKKADVAIVDRIFERGAERLGKYEKGLVTIAKGGDMERTAFHEALHGAEDMLYAPKELERVKQLMPDAEKRADAFMDYAAKRKGFTGEIKAYFDRLMYRIQKLFGKEGGIRELQSLHAKLKQGVLAKRGGKIVEGVASPDIRYRTPTGNAVLDSAFAKQDAGRKELLDRLDKKNSLWRRFKDYAGRNLLSQTAPISGRERDIGKLGGDVIQDLAQKSYMARQRQQGALGYAETRMNGYRDELKKAGFKTQQDMDDLGDYLSAKRTVELYDSNARRVFQGEEPIKSPLTRDEAEAIVNHFEQYPKFKSASDATQKAFRESLDHLRDAGVLSKDAIDRITADSKHYFTRRFLDKIDPEVGVERSKQGDISVRSSGLRFLKSGSEGFMITDPLVNVAQNIANAEVLAFKNKSNQALDDLVRNAPDALKKKVDLEMTAVDWDRTKNGGKGGFATEPSPNHERIEFWRDGQKQAIDVRKDLAQALKILDPALASDTAKILRNWSGTSAVKFLATSGSPEFAISNIPRDFGLHYLAGDQYSNIAPIALMQYVRNVVKGGISGDLYKVLKAGYDKHGGASGLLSSRDFMPSRDDLMSMKYKQGRTIMQGVLDALGYLGNKTEEMSRLSLVQQAFKKMKVDPRVATEAQLIEAVSNGKEILNFADGGRAIKVLDTMIPFLNPAFQGSRSIGRAFRDKPLETSLKASQIVAGAVFLYNMNRDKNEKALESISDGDMTTKLNVILDSEAKDKDGNTRYGYLGIPVDQSWRPFVLLGKMISDKINGKEVNPELLTKSIKANYVPGDINNMPPVWAALMTYGQNHDFWQGDKVWKGRDVLPEAEVKATTPEAFRKIGEATGMSPERLRVATKKLAPDNILTYGVQTAGEVLTGNKGKETADIEFSKMPFVRRLYRYTFPSELTEDLEKKAKKYGVSTEQATRKVRTDIKDVERTVNTIRQKNDLKFSELASKVKSGEMTKDDLYKEAWKVRNENGDFDGAERVRILRYLKKKYPEMNIIAPKEKR